MADFLCVPLFPSELHSALYQVSAKLPSTRTQRNGNTRKWPNEWRTTEVLSGSHVSTARVHPGIYTLPRYARGNCFGCWSLRVLPAVWIPSTLGRWRSPMVTNRRPKYPPTPADRGDP